MDTKGKSEIKVSLSETQDVSIDTSRPISMDQAYILAGGHGRYQKLAATAAVLGFLTNMLYIFSIPFFNNEPDIECRIGGVWQKCITKDICEPEISPLYRYVHKHQNFISEYDLLCKEDLQANIPFAYFLGVTLSCIVFSAFGDVYGRLPLLIMGQVGNVIGIAILELTSNYTVCLSVSAFIGFIIGINQSTPFNFIYDSMEGKYMASHASLLNMCWASGEILIALIMAWRPPWRLMTTVIIAVSTIFIVLLFWIVEPPRFHYSKGNTKKALQGIKYIARFNGATFPENVELDVESLKLDTTSNPSFGQVVKSLCSSRQVIFRVILACTCFFCSMLVYYGISVNLQRFAGSMVVNGIATAVAEILGVLTGNFLLEPMGKKPTLMMVYLIACVGMTCEANFEGYYWIESFSLYFAKFGSASGDNLLYVFAGEIFPTSIKSVALALGMVTCSFGSMFAPLVGLLGDYNMSMILAGVAFTAAFLGLLFPVKAHAETLDTVEQLTS